MGPDVHESLLTNKGDFQRIGARGREAGILARVKGRAKRVRFWGRAK